MCIIIQHYSSIHLVYLLFCFIVIIPALKLDMRTLLREVDEVFRQPSETLPVSLKWLVMCSIS